MSKSYKFNREGIQCDDCSNCFQGPGECVLCHTVTIDDPDLCSAIDAALNVLGGEFLDVHKLLRDLAKHDVPHLQLGKLAYSVYGKHSFSGRAPKFEKHVPFEAFFCSNCDGMRFFAWRRVRHGSTTQGSWGECIECLQQKSDS